PVCRDACGIRTETHAHPCGMVAEMPHMMPDRIFRADWKPIAPVLGVAKSQTFDRKLARVVPAKAFCRIFVSKVTVDFLNSCGHVANLQYRLIAETASLHCHKI